MNVTCWICADARLSVNNQGWSEILIYRSVWILP